jgi:hypothetical protein
MSGKSFCADCKDCANWVKENNCCWVGYHPRAMERILVWLGICYCEKSRWAK